MPRILNDEGEEVPEPATQAESFETAKPVPVERPPDTTAGFTPEEHVIACCLLDEGASLDLAAESNLHGPDFATRRLGFIFTRLRQMRAAEIPIGLETLVPELGERLEEAGGIAELIRLSDPIATANTHKAKHYIRVVSESAERRRLLGKAEALLEHAKNGTTIEELRESVAALVAEQPKTRAATASMLASRRVSIKAKPVEPVTRLFLAGKPIATPGNLVTLTSKAKTGKTAALGAVTAAVIAATTSTLDRDTFKFSAPNSAGHAVIVLDTEQSPYDAFTCYERSIQRAGTENDPPWLCHYSLVGYSVQQLHDALDLALEAAKKAHHGIFAIILDGVADFVASVNDEVECNAFVTWLRTRAIDHNCPIICVIHSNEAEASGDDGRGHIGKQLIRKAESNLVLKKSGEVTTITSDKQRKAPITEKDGVAFQWSDEKGMHVSCGTPETKRGAKKTKFLANYLSVFKTVGAEAQTFSVIHRAANTKAPIHRDTFWNLVTEGVDTGEVQVNRVNVNEPRYWVRPA